MLMNYHIDRLVLSSLCVGAFGVAGFRWRSFCRLNTSVVLFSVRCVLELLVWLVLGGVRFAG